MLGIGVPLCPFVADQCIVEAVADNSLWYISNKHPVPNDLLQALPFPSQVPPLTPTKPPRPLAHPSWPWVDPAVRHSVLNMDFVDDYWNRNQDN